MQSEDQSMKLDRIDGLVEISRNVARELKSDVRSDIYVGFRVLLKNQTLQEVYYKSSENYKWEIKPEKVNLKILCIVFHK